MIAVVLKRRGKEGRIPPQTAFWLLVLVFFARFAFEGPDDDERRICVYCCCCLCLCERVSERVMKASSIPMKASKAEVRAILPKGNEEQDNDDWAKFEVSAVVFFSLPHLRFRRLPSSPIPSSSSAPLLNTTPSLSPPLLRR